MSIARCFRQLAVSVLLASATGGEAQPQNSAYSQTILSVVEVVAARCSHGDRGGSGFFWGSKSSVVTALHVISGCQSVRVRYLDQGEFAVRAVRFDAARDIAELRLETTPQAPVLSRINKKVSVDEPLSVIGYQFSIPTADAFTVHVTPATVDHGTLREMLPGAQHSSAQSIGLNLDTRIVRVQPGVQPGASGAPVVNGNGELVGLGEGRLSSTVGTIGWITRVEYLTALGSRSWQRLQDVPDMSGAYLSGQDLTSATTSSDGDAVQCGDLMLRFRWRRTLSEITKTHNDPDGLREITKNASGIGLTLDSLAFRIWYEETTGGYIAIPADWPLSLEKGKCIARARNDKGGSVEIVGRTAASEKEAMNQLDEIQRQEEVTKPKGSTMTIKFRIFSNEREILTNAALINRRTYRGASRNSGEAVALAQTGFIRKRAALIVLGRTSMTVGDAMSYNICDIRKWEGKDCTRVKEASVDTAKALLSAALSTVPES